MADGYTQAQRLIRLQTHLGSNALIAEHLDGTENMSSGFRFMLNAFSETHHALDAKDLVGSTATIGLVQTDDSLRYLHGCIQEVSALGSARAGQLSKYSLALTSWLEMYLSQRYDCRIFQNKKACDVIREICSRYGSDANYKITLKQPRIEQRYWVQYNESDLNFFNRICQLEGLVYYFKHEKDSHQLCITDSAELLPMLSPQKVKLQPHSHGHDHLTHWQRSGRFATGKYEQRAYNYQTPRAPIAVKTTTKAEVADTPRVMDMESYLYSDTHHTAGDGADQVNARANQSVARSHIATGSGDCRHLALGSHFGLELATGSLGLGGHFSDKDKTFTLISVRTHADDTNNIFNCSIEAAPKGELVYPEAETPHINGLQTALVTGPAGEEIHTDALGRIKVQFHWDREGGKDENTTCWLRVMQSFAGPSFGAHFTPRIGQEVVVAFENGNPARPFVIGALYHPENPPPYASNKGTRGGIRTRSTKGGKASNCNELYFEDKKGDEEIYVQAEKDLRAYVKHNETRIIDDTLHIKAGKKIRLEVGGSEIEITGSSIIINSKLVDIDGDPVKIN